MRIPEEELADKRRRVKENQQHRKHRVDPADKPQGKASGPSSGKPKESPHGRKDHLGPGQRNHPGRGHGQPVGIFLET